jgi:hypothetical protein
MEMDYGCHGRTHRVMVATCDQSEEVMVACDHLEEVMVTWDD